MVSTVVSITDIEIAGGIASKAVSEMTIVREEITDAVISMGMGKKNVRRFVVSLPAWIHVRALNIVCRNVKTHMMTRVTPPVFQPQPQMQHGHMMR